MKENSERCEDNLELIVVQARQVYPEKVVQEWLDPTNMFALEQPDGYARLSGPRGDSLEIFIQIQDDRVARASFQTDGCTTTIACGSMAVELATERDLVEVMSISAQDIIRSLQGLPRQFSHCADLACDTLRSAVKDYLSKTHELRGAVRPVGTRH